MKELVYHAHADQVSDLAWSPDGTCLASASFDGTVQIWRLVSPEAEHLLTYTGHAAQSGQAPVVTVGWSPDGQRIASGSVNGAIQVWDAATGEQIATYPGHLDAPVRILAWSPDGSRIASGDEVGRAQVWNASTRQLIATYTGHAYLLDALAWSPDGTRLASASTYPEALVQTRHDIDEALVTTPFLGALPRLAIPSSAIFPGLGEDRGETERLAPLPSLAFPSAPDDLVRKPANTLSQGAEAPCTLHVWDAATGQAIKVYEGPAGGAIAAISWSPDGRYLVTGGRSLDVWDLELGTILSSYTGHSNLVTQVAWSPDKGREGNLPSARIASASHDRTIQVWNPFALEQRAIVYPCQDWQIAGLAWAPNGTLIAFGDQDGAVHIWEPA